MSLENEDVEDGAVNARGESHNGDATCRLVAVDDQSEQQRDGDEDEDAAAGVLPADAEDRRVDVESGAMGGIEGEVPSEPSAERSNGCSDESRGVRVAGRTANTAVTSAAATTAVQRISLGSSTFMARRCTQCLLRANRREFVA